MATQSGIGWCDSTWSFWLGCRRVSEGCRLCYIIHTTPFRLRNLLHGGQREYLSVAYWKEPIKWNRLAGMGRFRQCSVCGGREYRKWDGVGLTNCTTEGCLSLSETESFPVRPKVFHSLCDWLDDEVPIDKFALALDMIRRTPNLDWQLLTKRPQNWRVRLRGAMDYFNGLGSSISDHQRDTAQWVSAWLHPEWGPPPANVWVGVSTENQKRADERIPLLLAMPARVRFLSCEPLLGPVNIDCTDDVFGPPLGSFDGIHWVIAGGESSKRKEEQSTPTHPDWFRFLRDQCKATGVPFFFKQWGDYLPDDQRGASGIIADELGLEVLPVPLGGGRYGYRLGAKVSGNYLDTCKHEEMPKQSH